MKGNTDSSPLSSVSSLQMEVMVFMKSTVCVLVCACACVCLCVYMYIYVSVYVGVCACVRVCLCVYMYVSVSMCVCPNDPLRLKQQQQLVCREAVTVPCYWEVEWRGELHPAENDGGTRRNGADSSVLQSELI